MRRPCGPARPQKVRLEWVQSGRLLATEERMQNANPSQETSEEQGSRIPETPAQRSPKLGFAPAGLIERAAQRLDWTIAFGMRHDPPPGLEETTNQQLRPDPPPAERALPRRSRRTGMTRLLLVSGLCLASGLVAAAAGSGIFLLAHSAAEKATAEGGTDAPAKAGKATSLIRGLAIVPPVAGTAQSDTLASERGVKLSLNETSPSSPGGPQPKVAMMPAAKTLEAAPTFALPVPPNRPFSGADMAWLLARGDWLFATGDVASARFLYERGVDAGAARAAMKLGETFDPVYLRYSHLRGLRGDRGTAVFWYHRARDLGATEVANRLARLEAIERRN